MFPEVKFENFIFEQLNTFSFHSSLNFNHCATKYNFAIGCKIFFPPNLFYFRPKAGSLTEKRGKKAQNQINGEVKYLCELIDEWGSRGFKNANSCVSFRQIFQVSKIKIQLNASIFRIHMTSNTQDFVLLL